MGTFIAWAIAIIGLLLFLSIAYALGSVLSGLLQLLFDTTHSKR